MAQVEVSGVFAFAKQVKQEVSIAFCVRMNLCLSYKVLKHISHVLRNCLKATEIVKKYNLHSAWWKDCARWGLPAKKRKGWSGRL